MIFLRYNDGKLYTIVYPGVVFILSNDKIDFEIWRIPESLAIQYVDIICIDQRSMYSQNLNKIMIASQRLKWMQLIQFFVLALSRIYHHHYILLDSLLLTNTSSHDGNGNCTTKIWILKTVVDFDAVLLRLHVSKRVRFRYNRLPVAREQCRRVAA